MIEVVIAMFMTSVAVLAVFSLVAPAWRTTGKSDNLGRAAGILNQELLKHEARIMNACCQVLPITLNQSVTTGPTTVRASGQATAQTGDAQFNVTTTTTNLAANVWRVTVRVTWTGHPGISESMVVTRQQGFVFPPNCTVGGSTCQ